MGRAWDPTSFFFYVFKRFAFFFWVVEFSILHFFGFCYYFSVFLFFG